MGVKDGFSCYECDRSAKAHPDGIKPSEYLQDEDPKVKGWHTVTHTDLNGVTKTYTLCQSCFDKYQSIQLTWQHDFSEFAEEGYYPR